MRTLRVAALGLLAPCLFPGAVWGWGEDGHRIVGEIAWQLMTPEARSGARAFLPDGRYNTLYKAAVWADDYARQYERYDWLKPFHYVETDPADTEVDAPDNCDCVVRAIPKFADQLADPDQRYWLRVNGLRLLAHFVGDIHQPLHVGHPDGRGGNRTQVRFNRDRMNLHKVWDSGLIRHHLRNMAAFLAVGVDDFEREMEISPPREFDWEDYAQQLLSGIEADQIEAWTSDMDPEHWATESLGHGRALAFGVRDGEQLGTDYYDRAIPVVSERLQMAGARLAAMLNGIFAGD